MAGRPHLEPAILQGFLREELDSSAAAEVEGHLADCAHCRGLLARLEPLSEELRSVAGAVDLDELRWRRIQNAVKQSLEQPEEAPKPAPRRMGWVAGSAAAGFLLGVLLWPGQKTEPTPVDRPVTASMEPGPSASVFSAAEPVTITTRSGLALSLEPGTKIAVEGDRMEIEAGRVGVRRIDGHSGPIEVQTPELSVWADSHDFEVARVGAAASVELHEGAARLKRGQTPIQSLDSGESYQTGPIAKRGKPQVEPEPLPTRRTEEGTTRVEVTAPVGSAYQALWLEASAAFYTRRDAARALELTDALLQVAPQDAKERNWALGLRCQALIAERKPREAVQACAAQLGPRTDPELEREVHHTLGDLYRTQLGDCRKALDHYGQAMVFGRRSLLDTSARLGRARCALELGLSGLAQRDIATLARDGDAPEAEIDALKAKLEELGE